MVAATANVAAAAWIAAAAKGSQEAVTLAAATVVAATLATAIVLAQKDSAAAKGSEAAATATLVAGKDSAAAAAMTAAARAKAVREWAAAAAAVARLAAALFFCHRGSCIRSSPIGRLATWRVQHRSNYIAKLHRSKVQSGSPLCMLRILLVRTMAMARSRAVAVAVAKAVAAMGHRGSCIRSSPIARLAAWRVRHRSNYRPKLRRSRGRQYPNSPPCMLRILLAVAARSRQSLATL